MAGGLRQILRRALERTGLLVRARRLRNTMRAKAERRLLAPLYPDADLVEYAPEERAAFKAAGYHSQLGQDRYLWTRFFEGQPEGVFIDIGCNHPTKGNNSAFLEAQGWTGMAIDAQATFAAAWAKTRKTPFIHAAVSDEAATRDFVEFETIRGWEHELSSFADQVSPEDLASYRHRIVPVRCASLTELWTGGPIDLLMIDVEGAEHQVIDGADLPRLRPRFLMIENNRPVGGDETLRARIIAAGYRLVARINRTDDIYQRLDGDAS